jgi:hypothetical protein
MQQWHRSTPNYLMHISQDLKCNKDFIKAIEGCYAPGLACVAAKVSFLGEIQ